MISTLYYYNPVLSWKKVEKGNTAHLQIDEMVMELLDGVMSILTQTTNFPVLTDSLKQFHLGTVENARAYILENFTQDISLRQLAERCLVSPFHFSRIFKTVMNISPHQYLREVRLNHAKILLTTTGQSITDV